MGAREGRRILVRGVVQGVGFRPWVWRLAQQAGLAGRVFNDGQGVTIEIFGAPAALDGLVAELGQPPPAARIHSLQSEVIPAEAAGTFIIAPSGPAGEPGRRVSIPPDIATCADCLAEIEDARARRFHYALTNCTQCGPRFSIACEIPYDRARTTMASYAMCADCRREYEDPADRRFHAQPIACPACGPLLLLVDREGEALDLADPTEPAARLLAEGKILAVKGIGGYHLACDATSSPAVCRLRERKQRDQKPFAVMVRDLVAAEALALLDDAERAMLASVERPIVLVRRKADSGLAPEVAPENPMVGLLLAYSPLHHMLLAQAERPLVMTSGNLSEEPIAFDDADAQKRLAGIADAWLVHDRPIENACDDSVGRLIAGQPVLFRRSRGYVPRSIVLSSSVAPVLACGAHMKNTFCLAQGSDAYLGPHIGDLDNLETLAAYEHAVARLQRFVGIEPEIIAHDLHPGYQSTRYALARPEACKIAVQHHHAHVAAAMADRGLAGPVIGVAYDGTGLGTDGTAWGGEILLADFAHFERLATLRPIPLAGGDLAIQQVWRLALAVLDDAFDGAPPLDALALFRTIPSGEIALVRRMMAQRLNTPLAHGAGRYFDALGAIGLAATHAHFEGQVATRWNFAADPSEAGRYDFALDATRLPWLVDMRPMVRQATLDLVNGRTPAVVSARFHNTLVAATTEVLRLVRQQYGKHPVVFAGGCFQNARLSESLLAALAPDFSVHLPGQVPPGDGGLALGQALVADAVARAR
jgi:[NiFe] hydrogenase maturation protein HypF